MMGLLVFREQLKSFYAKYEVYVTPVIKFILALTAFVILNSNIGFMAKLKQPAVVVLLALFCSFMPYGIIVSIAAMFMLIHLYSLSMEIALITLAVAVAIALLYYGFRPGDSVILIVTPILFFLKIPYAAPIIFALVGGMTSVIPVCCAVIVYYMIYYVKTNAGVLTNASSTEITQRFTQIIDNSLNNRMMLLMILAFALTFVLVYVIRRLSVNYAWAIAIGAGTVVQLVVLLVGDFALDVSIPLGQMLLGMIGSVIVAGVIHFFVFAVDYSRTEYVQFEDDEYYYYVKAVPKITVTKPEVKVQKINARRTRRTARETGPRNNDRR